MSTKTGNWLQIKVFAALGVLLLGSISVISYLNILAHENHANQELLSYVRQLDVQGKAINRRGATYAQHAPRDYGPYNRDIIIFYPDFMKDLNDFDKKIKHVTQLANTLPKGFFYSNDNTIFNSINNLHKLWNSFLEGFKDKLGDNPQEPRLEWGAEYVQQNQRLINSITGMLIVNTEKAIEKRLSLNKKFSFIAITIAGLFLLLGIIWFYVSIVRRIALTVKGCQRVAQGDFGYQLPIDTNDELGSLAMAFNTLSARTRFVLTMLSKMHRNGTAESKVDSLWNEADGYLAINWLALWEVDKQNGQLNFMSMRSDKKIRPSTQKAMRQAATTDPHLLEISNNRVTVKYDDLNEILSTTPNALLVREIIKVGLLKSVMLIPLTSDDGWEGLLMFVANDAAAYTKEQVELMGNLAPFMANGFMQTDKTITANEPITASM